MSGHAGTAAHGASHSGPSEQKEEASSDRHHDQPEKDNPGHSGADRPRSGAGQSKDTSDDKHDGQSEQDKSNLNDTSKPGDDATAQPQSDDTDKPKSSAGLSKSSSTDEAGQPPPGPTMKQAAYARASDLKEQVNSRKEKIMSKTKPPGGFDDTPLPDAPPGYTVKFTFIKCTNLPPSDLHTTSADPYLVATLTTNLPRRHREDPPLQHRTRTIYRRTEPEWNEEWIVANVPASGFMLKCRLYDEDWPDHNDRLGNATVHVDGIDENWEGFPAPEGRDFPVKKRVGTRTGYLVKGIASALAKNIHMTPHMFIAAEVLGRSDPPHGQMYTLGPSRWIQHFSPMFGRITGTKVNKDSDHDAQSSQNKDEKKTQKHDFQANELQLKGPVPPALYHRYVEFRPLIGMMFSSHGLRGRILNKALHKQHKRVYNFDSSTKYGNFEPCSTEAATQLLKMAHFDEGGRIFTYVLTLDGLFRFTETGPEFGIDLLSKHTMHSDVATYIACSGEFFVRRLEHPAPSASRPEDDPEPAQRTHPDRPIPGGPPNDPPPHDPRFYQLVIDNDSGTYRPDKSVLPDLKDFLERQFPGLGVIALHCQDEELDRLKGAQRRIKRREGKKMNYIMNCSAGDSDVSSSDESALGEMENLNVNDSDDDSNDEDVEGAHVQQSGDGTTENGEGKGKGSEKKKSDKERERERARKSKHERAWDVLAEPKRLKGEVKHEVGSAAAAATGGRS